jgi:hypothetical protein
MMINDLLDMAMHVPPMLAAGWGAWFLVGLLLSIWGRREKGFMVVHQTDEHKSGVRAAAGTKPPSGVRAPVKPSKSVPATEGDPFGDLEKLFEPQTGTHRTPGEAPMAEMTVTRSNGAALAAPQSLP